MRDTDRHIRTTEDVLRLLDGLFAEDADRWTQGGARWWDAFYEDRSRPVPFFARRPDESLVAYARRVRRRPGTGAPRALDLGCGPGRNTLHLAAQGFEVDAVDLSPEAIAWARDRAATQAAAAPHAPGRVRFHCGNAFELPSLEGPFDLIHDSGCFHHLPPHRRVTYLGFLERHLAPGGHLSLTCFAAGAENSGSELPDAEFYRTGGLRGGLAYTPGSLRTIFSGLECVELRRMREQGAQSAYFGESFLWTGLFRRRVERPASRCAPGAGPQARHA